MPTAWEILTANSSLQSGTAWQHLNAQQGGGLIIAEGEYVGEIITMEGVTEIITDESAELSAIDSVTEIITEAEHGNI